MFLFSDTKEEVCPPKMFVFNQNQQCREIKMRIFAYLLPMFDLSAEMKKVSKKCKTKEEVAN